MTVESLIKSAIADEVNANLNPKTVTEIVNKKVQRLAKKSFDQKEMEQVIKRAVFDWLKSWDGQKFLRSVIADSVTIQLTKE